MRTFAIATVAVAALLGTFTLFNSFSSVSPGEKGVIVTMGQIVGVAGPGVFPKVPFVTNVHIINLRDQVINFDGLQAYTKDQQTATVSRVSMTYRVDPSDEAVIDIYERYGSSEALVEQLVTRRVGAALEGTFGQYNAELAVRDRVKLGADFSAQIKATEGPMTITQVNVENFSFPPEYEANINSRMAAEVAALQAEQTAKKTVIEARALADSQLAIATADAQATTLRGNAEADAIRAKGAALRDNPALVSLTAAERWDGVLPQTMVPGGATPFVNVGQ